MERCLCCKARLAEAVICPRCQADLSYVISSEHYARYWLAHALRFWLEQEPDMAIQALTKSLQLKQTQAALVFRTFIIQKQLPEVLGLLAQNNALKAKQRLRSLRELQPDNELVRQLQQFTGSLLVKHDSYLPKLLAM